MDVTTTNHSPTRRLVAIGVVAAGLCVAGTGIAADGMANRTSHFDPAPSSASST